MKRILTKDRGPTGSTYMELERKSGNGWQVQGLCDWHKACQSSCAARWRQRLCFRSRIERSRQWSDAEEETKEVGRSCCCSLPSLVYRYREAFRIVITLYTSLTRASCDSAGGCFVPLLPRAHRLVYVRLLRCHACWLDKKCHGAGFLTYMTFLSYTSFDNHGLYRATAHTKRWMGSPCCWLSGL